MSIVCGTSSGMPTGDVTGPSEFGDTVITGPVVLATQLSVVDATSFEPAPNTVSVADCAMPVIGVHANHRVCGSGSDTVHGPSPVHGVGDSNENEPPEIIICRSVFEPLPIAVTCAE